MLGSEEYSRKKTTDFNNMERGCCGEDDACEVDDGHDDKEQDCENKEVMKTPENHDTKMPYKSTWSPSVYYRPEKEIYNFAGYEICIYESLDSYGSMIWPGAVALCTYLETPAGREQVNLLDKSAIEIGAGTGLLSIVATLLGAKVTATDLPEILGNLRCNLSRNTKWHCRHPPQVAALSWGHELEDTFPRSAHHYDYILAADVVYHHSYLNELLVTMCYLCQPGTTLIWSNKIRYQSDLGFVERFKESFHTTLLAEKDDIRIYMATARGVQEDSGPVMQMEEHKEEEEQTVKEEESVHPTGDVKTENKTEIFQKEKKQRSLDKDVGGREEDRNAGEKYEDKDVNKNGERKGNVKMKIDTSEGHKEGEYDQTFEDLNSPLSHAVQNTDGSTQNKLYQQSFTENLNKAFHNNTLLDDRDKAKINTAEPQELQKRNNNRTEIPQDGGQLDTKKTSKDKENKYHKVAQKSKEEKWDRKPKINDNKHTSKQITSGGLIQKVENVELNTKLSSMSGDYLANNIPGSEECSTPKMSSEENAELETECRGEGDGDEGEETGSAEAGDSCGPAQQNDEKELTKTSDNHNTNMAYKSTWSPSVYYRPEKEIYNFAGYEICIYESLDSYGSMIWPGAVALCTYLETPAGREQVNLLDKSAIEIGAGTGLLSIVATLLGAKVTATDLPEILGNLRCNLSRNTKWHCRHPPQVAALSWGHELEDTFPRSAHHYDYILAADVVYHHSYLNELLVTMRYLCQPGTTLIWSNKIRYQSDLGFVERFKESFHTTLLAEKDDIKIYMATARGVQEDSGPVMQMEEHKEEEEQTVKEEESVHPTEDVKTENKTEIFQKEKKQRSLDKDVGGREEDRNAGEKYEDKDVNKNGEKKGNVKMKIFTSKGHKEGECDQTSEDLNSPLSHAVQNTDGSTQNKLYQQSFTENINKAFHNNTLLDDRDKAKINTAEPQELQKRNNNRTEIPQDGGQLDTKKTSKDKENKYHKVAQKSKEEKWDRKPKINDNKHTSKQITSGGLIRKVENVELNTKLSSMSGDYLANNIPGSEECSTPEMSSEKNAELETECRGEGEGDEGEETGSAEAGDSCGPAQQNDEKELTKTSDNHNTNMAYKSTWSPSVYYRPEKEIYNFAGYEICIYESLDSYGSMIWPGAVALCTYLETPAGREQVNLLDKSAIEIGAGTGLLSIVATLLGAKVTATDLPEILGNLRCNLSRNTKWHCRHPPQVAALSWGHELEDTFPRSAHHYDYILAADVVYHHSYLNELLVTMRYLCQPGTTLIWSNKIRYQSDLGFVERFKESFHTTLLAEKDDIRIYLATARGVQEDSGPVMQMEEHKEEEEQTVKEEESVHPTGDVKTENKTEIFQKEKKQRRLDKDVGGREQDRNAGEKYEDKDVNKNGERKGNVKMKIFTSEGHKEGEHDQTFEDKHLATARGVQEDSGPVMQMEEHKEEEEQTVEEEENVCRRTEDVKTENKTEIFQKEKKKQRCLNEDVEGREQERNAGEKYGKSERNESPSDGPDEGKHHLEHDYETSQDKGDQTTSSISHYGTSDINKLNYPDPEIHNFVGYEITVRCLLRHGGKCGPATLALCKFLDNNTQQVNLQGKSVLELGAGTGMVSIVASLLGAWVTATDLPEVLEILTENLNANTKGRSKYPPQAEVLPWGQNLARSFPSSIYHYDFVLAADVVYCHNSLKELLATMCHFCQRGTTLIWANEFHHKLELAFKAQFKRALHTELLVDGGDVKIYMGWGKGTRTPFCWTI